MEAFVVASNAVFPICLLILLGYVLKQKKMLNTPALKTMNQLAYKILIPLNLMESILKTDFGMSLDGRLIGYAVALVICITLIGVLLVPLITKDRLKQGVLVQGFFRTNFVLLGIPICESLCGSENIGVTSLLVSTIVPLINLLAVLVLQSYGGGKSSPRTILVSVLKNPIIIASATGVLIHLLRVPLPEFMLSTIGKLSKSATPIALIVLGGNFELSNIKKNIREVCALIIGKLVLLPAIVLSISIWVFHFRGVSLASLLVLCAGPVAVSSFPMAEAMGLDGKLAGEIVFASTLVCLFTLFCWIAFVSNLGLL